MNIQDAKEKLDVLNHFIESLSSLTTEYCILVEGRKDMLSLKALGISSKVLSLKSWKGSLISKLEEIEEPNLIVLTDLDEEGEYLASLIYRFLNGSKHVILEYRNMLKKRFKGELKGIEELPKLQSRLCRILKNVHCGSALTPDLTEP
ncbi:MAG TPA: hypothetical protein ENF41_01085 [Candidatus Bathyarchaeota archaeon]|nr:hypothetical protein [Candidatus Bathyarchaeota archaeon]